MLVYLLPALLSYFSHSHLYALAPSVYKCHSRRTWRKATRSTLAIIALSVWKHFSDKCQMFCGSVMMRWMIPCHWINVCFRYASRYNPLQYCSRMFPSYSLYRTPKLLRNAQIRWNKRSSIKCFGKNIE